MDDQKLENLLNLSLQATQEERNKSLVLEEGYIPEEQQWELIVKYSGDFSRAATLTEQVNYLLNEYAIVRIGESNIDAFSSLPEIEFIEKPKRLFFALEQARLASCLLPVQREPLSLFGTGVLVAVIDSGVDIFNRDFQNPDGTTRIVALWDQTIAGERDNPSHRSDLLGNSDEEEQANASPTKETQVAYGKVFLEEEINEILRSRQFGNSFLDPGGLTRIPGEDRSGHGTAVLGIAAGNGANSGGRNRGVAPSSPLLVVKLGVPDPQGFPRTTQLMEGVDFAVRKALELQLPVAINISFGNSYGPHDSTSLLELFLDDLSNYWKTVIVIGSGNEGAVAGHTGFTLEMGQSQTVQLSVSMFEPGVNVQIWKRYIDEVEIVVVHPNGNVYEIMVNQSGAHRVRMGNTELLIFVGEPGPYSVNQEIFVDFLPVENYVDSGVWEFRFLPRRIVVGRVDLWIPGGRVLSAQTRFLNPSEELTLTIPSTSRRAITVAAYDSRRDTLADFSGRGSFLLGKPDLAAPGVDLTAPTPGNGYGSFSGTSMAAPMVTGSAALLMEWGIVNGNDPYLYGEKVKAYLQKGARQLPFVGEYPNPLVGYGALCVEESLPT